MNNGGKSAPRRVTSIDVAERAGVSQSTVSRALSGSETITQATRRRVELAAEELGYHVNARAAGLRGRGHDARGARRRARLYEK